MSETSLLEVGIALFTLAVIGTGARLLGQSVIPAYIISGILVGPYVPTNIGSLSLRLVTDGEFLTVVAELGIVFLLFFLGLEFSVGTLLRNRTQLAKIGGIDLVANSLIGVGIFLVFGFGVTTIVLLTGVVYISSSAIITKALTEVGWLANPESEVILGTLVVEDIVIAVYLAVVSALVVGGGPLGDVAVTVAQSFLFLGILATAAHYGTEYVDRVFAVESNELFLLRIVGTTVLIGGTAVAIGVSEAVAAFFVGTAFHGTDLVERIEEQLSPLRDVFAALFFFSIGVSTDLLVVADVGVLIVVAVMGTTVVKVGSGFVSGYVYDLSPRRSFRVGLGLIPRGEFSLIIAAIAATSSIPEVQEVVPAFAVGYVLVMSILGTLCIQYSGPLTRMARITV
ncbi:cation:proton antiporter [Haloarcula sp. JP-L23]|uniref:cation:proton antiporter n=1 Tax=Haloarcula sp. JP-L23 TaxID=2716717 RepID=UPI00140F1BD6|nr:cation:proton antiporter [Haloarcula sp. JP-L23]